MKEIEKRPKELKNPVQIYAIETLRTDDDFTPAEGSEIVTYLWSGVTISAHTSYYRQLLTGENVLIRAAEHGTALNNWVGKNRYPQTSFQNVSVVFTETTPTAGSNLTASTDTFFIVEQYYYILRSINNADVKKIITQIKNIQSTDDAEKVFIDPFRNDPKKKAGVQILRPYKDGVPIPPPESGVNQRQLDIINGKIKLDERDIIEMVKECVNKIINGQYLLHENKFGNALAAAAIGTTLSLGGCNINNKQLPAEQQIYVNSGTDSKNEINHISEKTPIKIKIGDSVIDTFVGEIKALILSNYKNIPNLSVEVRIHDVDKYLDRAKYYTYGNERIAISLKYKFTKKFPLKKVSDIPYDNSLVPKMKKNMSMIDGMWVSNYGGDQPKGRFDYKLRERIGFDYEWNEVRGEGGVNHGFKVELRPNHFNVIVNRTDGIGIKSLIDEETIDLDELLGFNLLNEIITVLSQ